MTLPTHLSPQSKLEEKSKGKKIQQGWWKLQNQYNKNKKEDNSLGNIILLLSLLVVQ